jgi:3-deoxy-D-manno-octulosonate 8-phosphate phosphatase (KDO 8-P phosphatase)
MEGFMGKDSSNTPKVFLLDVDGVMTTGQFSYTAEGKSMKVFGPDDNDALSLLRNLMEIRFITGDKNGLEITKRRIVDDMKYPLDTVSVLKRIDWISEHYNPKEVIYMGDGIFDHFVFQKIGYSIAPGNANSLAKKYANFVTARNGGDRAVAEACLHILEKFFKPFDSENIPESNTVKEWTV